MRIPGNNRQESSRRSLRRTLSTFPVRFTASRLKPKVAENATGLSQPFADALHVDLRLVAPATSLRRQAADAV